MSPIKKLTLAIACVLSLSVAFAQNKTVSGVVSAISGESVIGAGVLVDGTTKGVTTDIDGRYSIDVPSDAVLVISSIGYKTLKVKVDGRAKIDVTLENDNQLLEEAVAVGYGNQSKLTLTGSVAQTTGRELVKNSSVNLSQGLAGRMPGVIVNNRSGEPGKDDATMFIRGRSTLGNNSPLIIIDGVPGRGDEFSRLTGEEIESINVLKDASGAIYGARSANGVILVTTKRGKYGEAPRVTFTYDLGLQQPTKTVKMADAVLYAEAYNASLAITGAAPLYNETQLNHYRTGDDPILYPNVDWYDLIVKPISAQHKYGVSINGGSDRVAYFVQFNGQYQDGIYHKSATNYNQHNVRSNIDIQVTKGLKSLIDLCSVEGSTVWEVERTPEKPAHTLGNGKSMNAPIPMLEEWFIWNQHPWYENENDGGPVKYNEQPISEVDIAFMMRVMPWHLTRSSQLGAIGNFQQFGTSKESTLYYEGYIGLICPMREFLICARIFKYILDNDITSNVYDAIKDQKFSFDLYGSEKPDIALDVDKMNFTYEGGEQKVKVTTKDSEWTATVEGEGITVSPESGAAGAETEVTVTAAPNTGGTRVATVTFTTATGKSKKVSIQQGASPTNATIREFATEYVKLIDVWMKNVGTVNTSAGVGAAGDGNDVENAHYVPDETTITVGETTFNLADALELASRSYLLLRGYDGNDIKTYGRNLPIAKIDPAYTMDSKIPETHSYTWGAHPYAEPTNGGYFKMITAEGEFELVKTDLLDDYSHRHTNYPNGAGEGAISNFCSYTGGYLAGYDGTCCAKRIMMAYAYFFKYMLDNNLQDATGISPDQTFKAPLFHDADASKPTIRAFAEEYVKLIDVWKKTTGTVNYMSPTGYAAPDFSYSGVPNIENGHYIPLDTKITVAGAEYTTAEVFDVAIRSYLLLRGIDATDEAAVGAGAFGKLEKAYTMDDNFLPARPLTWGPAPFNETGTTAADGSVSGNGGNLKMGTPPNGEDKVKVDLLDNFAERNANFATVKNKNAIGNMAGYTNRLEGYYGCASGHRMLLTYAYFFKYMLDNNLSDATQISADQTFESYHFGEGMAEEPAEPTIKAFAKEYVKLIDVWKNNVGTVNVVAGVGAKGDENDVENAHYIPDETTVTVGETVYTLADAVEIASRSYLLLRGYDGNNTEVYGRNLPMPKADKDYTMASDIPATHDYTWGSYPYAERTNGGAFKMVTSEGDFELMKTDILDDYSQRHTNFPGTGGALSNFCSYTGGYLAGYDGCCCVKRITLAYAYFFKYMLDNDLEDAKGISDNQTFNAPLFEVPAN